LVTCFAQYTINDQCLCDHLSQIVYICTIKNTLQKQQCRQLFSILNHITKTLTQDWLFKLWLHHN
jgi:hypothetical protein